MSFLSFLIFARRRGDFSIFGQFLGVFIYLSITYPSSLRWKAGTYPVKNEYGTDEYDIKTTTKRVYWHPIQGVWGVVMVACTKTDSREVLGKSDACGLGRGQWREKKRDRLLSLPCPCAFFVSVFTILSISAHYYLGVWNRQLSCWHCKLWKVDTRTFA